MQNSEKARRFLTDSGQEILANLLLRTEYDYRGYQYVNGSGHFLQLVLKSPPIYTVALKSVQKWECEYIAEAFLRTHRWSPSEFPVQGGIVYENGENPEADNLYAELYIQKNLMMDVATGSTRIQTVELDYRARKRRITRDLRAIGIEDPIQFNDLWEWYRKWKEEFPTYQERRDYLNDLFLPLLHRLIQLPSVVVPERDPTGWERVDRTIDKAQISLSAAKVEEDFQTIGLLCREVLISLGQAVYDSTIHAPSDGVEPSKTDAKRMIEAFFNSVVPGSSYESIRRHAKASLQLAVELQHKRTANFRDAALCLEATFSTLNIVAILSGRRGPDKN